MIKQRPTPDQARSLQRKFSEFLRTFPNTDYWDMFGDKHVYSANMEGIFALARWQRMGSTYAAALGVLCKEYDVDVQVDLLKIDRDPVIDACMDRVEINLKDLDIVYASAQLMLCNARRWNQHSTLCGEFQIGAFETITILGTCGIQYDTRLDGMHGDIALQFPEKIRDSRAPHSGIVQITVSRSGKMTLCTESFRGQEEGEVFFPTALRTMTPQERNAFYATRHKNPFG